MYEELGRFLEYISKCSCFFSFAAFLTFFPSLSHTFGDVFIPHTFFLKSWSRVPSSDKTFNYFSFLFSLLWHIFITMELEWKKIYRWPLSFMRYHSTVLVLPFQCCIDIMWLCKVTVCAHHFKYSGQISNLEIEKVLQRKIWNGNIFNFKLISILNPQVFS